MPATEVLFVQLEALGAVLRATSLLPAVHRAWPGARVTWLTRPRATALLEGNPLVDRVLPLGVDALAELEARRFDVLLCCDKSPVAGGIAARVQAADKRGFGVSATGAVLPLTEAARHLWELGLDDHLKFHVNQRTEQDLLAEALGLEYRRDPYVFQLRDDERPAGPPRLVGFNTGCSPLYPYKKLSIEVQAEAARRIADRLGQPVLLLGGPEDAERNAMLARLMGDRAEPTPTDLGLRRGAAEIDRCEVVVTGDSLGMHLAIALRKHVVVWFGVTCPQEIDLYGRGVKLLADVDCAPCWRRQCDRKPRCDERVDPAWIEQAVLDCLEARRAGREIDEVRGARS